MKHQSILLTTHIFISVPSLETSSGSFSHIHTISLFLRSLYLTVVDIVFYVSAATVNAKLSNAIETGIISNPN